MKTIHLLASPHACRSRLTMWSRDISFWPIRCLYPACCSVQTTLTECADDYKRPCANLVSPLFGFLCYRKLPDLDLQGLFKRHFTIVEFFQGSIMDPNDLERVKVQTLLLCLSQPCCSLVIFQEIARLGLAGLVQAPFYDSGVFPRFLYGS